MNPSALDCARFAGLTHSEYKKHTPGGFPRGLFIEKSLKRWYRKWKLDLIEAANPDWHDLYDAMIAEFTGSSGQARG